MLTQDKLILLIKNLRSIVVFLYNLLKNRFLEVSTLQEGILALIYSIDPSILS